MKQTAIDFLKEKLTSVFVNDKAFNNLFEQAKQMEKQEQDKIYDHAFKYGQLSAPELSDEEIKEKMFGGQFDDQDDDDLSMFFGAKWYREQLKQRQ